MKNENLSQINLDDGNKILISHKKYNIKIFLTDSSKVIYHFDSFDVKGLSFFDEHSNPLNYLLEQISNDSDIDEILDTCESIKDNIKELYRVNPNLIRYNEVYLSDENLETENNFMTNDTMVHRNLINWKSIHGYIILLALLLIAALIGLRQKIYCSLQGGEIREYEPIYEVVDTGQVFEVDWLEYACFRETPAGYKKLFDIK